MPDPSALATSAFSARWAGYLTADCTVDNVSFSINGRSVGKTSLRLNGRTIKTDGSSTVSVVKGERIRFDFEYSQQDSTGQHPAFALQWSLQGLTPEVNSLDAVEGADAVVAVVGGSHSTSGEGVDRASCDRT